VRKLVREAQNSELGELLELYLDLHEDSVPPIDDRALGVWQKMMDDENHHIIVNIQDGRIVSSCVCVIIPNLTRGIRPYAFIENVVTRENHRGRGFATECLDFAREIAKRENCYKMMLLTGSKSESTLDFYKRAGYNCTDKTAFIQWLD
jgi:GNAT superfamily N-acetyltransferase